MMQNGRLGEILGIVSGVLMAVSLYVVFLVVPPEATMGDVQRIFYFHVSASWTGYLALFVTLVSSLIYLRRREPYWDALALSSVEIGLVYITLGIVTGSIWAKATWGTWWTWDPRLTTSAVLWIVYLSYIILRRAIEEPDRRARLASVYSVVAFVAVPVNFMAIRWWRAAHPLILNSSGFQLSPAMLRTMFLCLLTFTLFYMTLLYHRLRLEMLALRIEQLKVR
jgi:heme exporter protein C